MKRFTTEQLHTFATVVEEQTFEEAALVLRVTASAISQRIKAMEQASGQVLLRRSNPVEPTDAGRTVLRLAQQIEQLTLEAQRELTGEPGDRRLAVAANSDSLATWFLDAVAAVPRAERIFCEVRREDEMHSSALLRSGAVMAALTADPQPVQGCSVERLGTMRYWIAASAEFVDAYFPGFATPPAPPRGGITEEQLAAAPSVRFDRKDIGLDAMAELLAAEHGLRPQHHAPRVFIPSSTEYHRAVELGLGWGGIPEQQCAGELESGRLVRLVERPIDVAIFWQRWTIASPALESLTDAVRATAARALRG
ncbi:LysR family transcriptional regulator ArgP [Rothia sp. AR01]|uniref:LysR family transcriptional regulator ArgP n=1 Tax=Rothia santali TaxID=2949643 RepID=A0A9X2HDB3_9MICC|nr:LysR family transcriptional regulator ArgP [Rothia santali]MCP3426180.1 LysR family transcriptional regulator ArgP [Rothia santali]